MDVSGSEREDSHHSFTSEGSWLGPAHASHSRSHLIFHCICLKEPICFLQILEVTCFSHS